MKWNVYFWKHNNNKQSFGQLCLPFYDRVHSCSTYTFSKTEGRYKSQHSLGDSISLQKHTFTGHKQIWQETPQVCADHSCNPSCKQLVNIVVTLLAGLIVNVGIAEAGAGYNKLWNSLRLIDLCKVNIIVKSSKQSRSFWFNVTEKIAHSILQQQVKPWFQMLAGHACWGS